MNKLYKYKNGKRIRALKDIKCPVCKKMFAPKTSKNKYCSRECYYEMKRIRGDRVFLSEDAKRRISEKMSGENNHRYGKKGYWTGKKRLDISGKNSSNWRGGCYISKGGYKIHCINGKDVPEHRIIMEEYLGRKLLSTEIVHHIDRDGLNNKISNLKLVSRSEHINIHREDLKHLG